MTAHIKAYMMAFGYGEQDFIPCEVHKAAGYVALAADIHHIVYRSQGGKNTVDNLIALCRDCHDQAHGRAGKKGARWWRDLCLMVVKSRNTMLRDIKLIQEIRP